MMGMSAAAIGGIFTLAWVVFAIPCSIFLLRSYSRSKMTGFLWLFGAVVAWPFCARILNLLLPAVAASQHLPYTSILILNLASGLVGSILLLIAVIVLDQELTRRLMPATAAPPPPASL